MTTDRHIPPIVTFGDAIMVLRPPARLLQPHHEHRADDHIVYSIAAANGEAVITVGDRRAAAALVVAYEANTAPQRSTDGGTQIKAFTQCGGLRAGLRLFFYGDLDELGSLIEAAGFKWRDYTPGADQREPHCVGLFV